MNQEQRRLSTLVQRSTWAFGTLAVASTVLASVYATLVLSGTPALPTPVNLMLCLILATSISGVMTTRSAARLQLGQLDLLERLETYESRLDHRDGKIYMAVARVNAGHDALARRMADLEEVTSEQPGLRHPSTAQAEIVRIGARITSKITGE